MTWQSSLEKNKGLCRNPCVYPTGHGGKSGKQLRLSAMSKLKQNERAAAPLFEYRTCNDLLRVISFFSHFFHHPGSFAVVRWCLTNPLMIYHFLFAFVSGLSYGVPGMYSPWGLIAVRWALWSTHHTPAQGKQRAEHRKQAETMGTF